MNKSQNQTRNQTKPALTDQERSLIQQIDKTSKKQKQSRRRSLPVFFLY